MTVRETVGTKSPPGLSVGPARALLRRCPRCGSTDVFRAWFKMAEDCPRCGLHFERLAGYWLGSIALNLVATEALFVMALIGMLAVTWSDVPWTLVLVVLVGLNTAVPIVFHPISRTLWVAFDRHFSHTWDDRAPPG